MQIEEYNIKAVSYMMLYHGSTECFDWLIHRYALFFDKHTPDLSNVCGNRGIRGITESDPFNYLRIMHTRV